MFLFTVMLGIFCSNVAFQLEQSCSKFHYEEQTLEKMIRLQIFVEQMQEKLEETKTAVVDEVKMLKADIKNMKDKMEHTKAELKDDLSNMKTQHLDAVNKYSDVTAKNKESNMAPPVAFSSHTVTDKDMADNKVIVFTVVQFNYNASYDKTTGIFTIPLNGIYIFVANICIINSEWGYYGIFVNDESVSHGLLGNKPYYRCFTITAVVKVAKGDRVSIRCQSSCFGDNLFENDHSSSRFSSALINTV